ncbi:MAG: outer membrane beta-barrel protein [Bacteroidia bacterium]|nr:outer membrane beta-barrel protein [Bacteroidia bacterium]
MRVLPVVFWFALGILNAQARVGIVLAPQATTAKGQMDKDYFVLGFAGGLSGEVLFTERAAVGIDLLGSFAGWREEERSGNSFIKSEHRLTTLQVPVYVRAQWLELGEEGAGLSAVLGVQSDVLLGARSRLEGARFSKNVSEYSRFAGSLLGGIGFSYEGDYAFSVDVRSAYSFINLKRNKGGRINPAWFMLRVAFYFGQ